jgi:hypothetical protein
MGYPLRHHNIAVITAGDDGLANRLVPKAVQLLSPSKDCVWEAETTFADPVAEMVKSALEFLGSDSNSVGGLLY